MERLRVKQVAAATGLEVEQVKVWIYNRNRKKRKSGEGPRKGGEGPTKSTQPSGALQTHGRPAPGGGTSSDVGPTASRGSPEEATSSRPDDLDSQEPEPELEQEVEGEGSFSHSVDRQKKKKDPDLDPEDPDLETDQRPDRHQEIATEFIQAVEEQVHKLHTCNCEVAVMVYNHSSGALYTTGTPKGLDFLNSQTPAVHWQFSGAMSNSSSTQYSYS